MYKGDLVRLRPYRKEDIPRILELINDAEIKALLTPGYHDIYVMGLFRDEWNQIRG